MNRLKKMLASVRKASEDNPYDREREAAAHRDAGDNAMAYNVLIEQGLAARARIAELEETAGVNLKTLLAVAKNTRNSCVVVHEDEGDNPFVLALGLGERGRSLFRFIEFEETDGSLMERARAAYVAYGDSVGGKNYLGAPMPKWEDLPEKIQNAWKAATAEISSLCAAEGPLKGEVQTETE